MPKRIWFAVVGAVSLLFGTPVVLNAQESPKPPAKQQPNSKYPRVNPSIWYEVDANWPQRPSDFQWKAMPGIAVDKQDRVWTFTRSVPPVQVYSTDGRLLRAWGDALVKTAHHIEIGPDGNIWIADIGSHVVHMCSPGGEVLRTLGVPGEPGEDEKRLNKPTDMAISPLGDVFVSDGYGNNRIVHFDAEGRFVKQWGSLGNGPEHLSMPHAIAIDSTGRLYVADRNNARIQVYNQRGELLDSWSDLIVPWGIWVTPQDDIWVCGASPMRWRDDPDYPGAPLSCPPKDQILMRFDMQGKLRQLWTLPKGQDGQEQPGDVNWIHAMAVDSHGNLYVADIQGKRAQKLVVHSPEAP